MRRRAAWLWLLPLGLGFACGGRFQQTPGSEGDDDEVAPYAGNVASGGSGATSGKTAKGGRPAKGGSAGKGGTSTGKAGTAVGGAVGIGGSVGIAGTTTIPVGGTVSAGGACFCDDVACGIDYQPVPDPDGCCYHCELDFKACELDRQDYRSVRQQMIEKYSTLGCMRNEDCSIYYDKTNCSSTCGFVIPNAAREYLDQNLYSYAQQKCSPACPPEPVPPCPAPAPPQCLKGHCY